MTEYFVIATADLQKTRDIEIHQATYNEFLRLYFKIQNPRISVAINMKIK